MIDLIAALFTRLAPGTQPVRVYLYDDGARRWTRHYDETNYESPADAFRAFDAAFVDIPRGRWHVGLDAYLLTFRPHDQPADLFAGHWLPCQGIFLCPAPQLECPQSAKIERAGEALLTATR